MFTDYRLKWGASFLAALAVILGCLGCGSEQNTSAPAAASSPPDARAAIELGSPRTLEARLQASGVHVDDTFKTGAAFDAALPHANVAADGAALAFTPGAGSNDMAYACFAFDPTGDGEPSIILLWHTFAPGHTWLGMANFAKKHWDWGELTSDSLERPSDPDYISESGKMLMVVLVDGGAPAELASVATSDAASSALLDCIPADLPPFPLPGSYLLDPGEGQDMPAPGESAGRLWTAADGSNLVIAQVSDWLTEDAALAALAAAQPVYGGAMDLGGNIAWLTEDPQIGGAPGVRMLQFVCGPYMATIGASVLELGAEPASSTQLGELAAAIDAALAALPGGSHGASSLLRVESSGLDLDLDLAALGDWPPDEECPCSAGADGIFSRQTSEARTVDVPLDLKKGGETVGKITLMFEITPTSEPCAEQTEGTMSIVKVYIKDFSLNAGADDGDPTAGAGDMMAGGNISVSFTGAGGAVSVGSISFATGEMADCSDGESGEDNDSDHNLPKFIGTIKGCGIPTSIQDVDILLRDNDAGTDALDVISSAVSVAVDLTAPGLHGKEVKKIIDGLGEKASDASGTDGMKLVRDKDKDGVNEPGDDVAESHDAEVPIPGE